MEIQLLVGVIFGTVTAVLANNKGRSALGWFFIGFFLGCIGLIILLVVADLNEEKNKEARNEREQRRLREQLKQERIKSETFQDHVKGRLDTHDKALGVDTRQPSQLSGGQQPSGYLAQPPPLWYYEEKGEQLGPISQADLIEMIKSGQLDCDTLVWQDRMQDWTAADQVRELQTHFT
jgi:hypothetical protein